MSYTIEKLAIVIVTYRREQLLDNMLESLLFLENAPWRVYVVDNDASPDVRELVSIYSQLVEEGVCAVEWPGGADTFRYILMDTNTGGAGGFAEGVRRAYRDGAEWFWLMDDDVEAMPSSIRALARWTGDFDAIQGARLDFDGGPFYWQYRFLESLGMYNPVAPSSRSDSGWRPANALCFEGALFNRKVVAALGPPDARFFVYWDDCVYGYLASKITNVVVVEDVILKRTRHVDHKEIGSVRQLNSFSDMTRYHVMKNRGHMGNYMRLAGDYNPAMFGLGTLMVAAKEAIRLALVDRRSIPSGLRSIFRGWRDARRLLHDRSWRPVTPEDL